MPSKVTKFALTAALIGLGSALPGNYGDKPYQGDYDYVPTGTYPKPTPYPGGDGSGYGGNDGGYNGGEPPYTGPVQVYSTTVYHYNTVTLTTAVPCAPYTSDGKVYYERTDKHIIVATQSEYITTSRGCDENGCYGYAEATPTPKAYSYNGGSDYNDDSEDYSNDNDYSGSDKDYSSNHSTKKEYLSVDYNYPNFPYYPSNPINYTYQRNIFNKYQDKCVKKNPKEYNIEQVPKTYKPGVNYHEEYYPSGYHADGAYPHGYFPGGVYPHIYFNQGYYDGDKYTPGYPYGYTGPGYYLNGLFHKGYYHIRGYYIKGKWHKGSPKNHKGPGYYLNGVFHTGYYLKKGYYLNGVRFDKVYKYKPTKTGTVHYPEYFRGNGYYPGSSKYPEFYHGSVYKLSSDYPKDHCPVSYYPYMSSATTDSSKSSSYSKP